MSNVPAKDTYQWQDAILAYDSRMNLSREDKTALHRLFSPLVVPMGFTDAEVRLCIKLDKLRDELRDESLVYYMDTFSRSSLHDDFQNDISRTAALKETLYAFMIIWANK